MVKRLIVSPHPDDAEIGMGGLVHRCMKLGVDFTIAVCTGEGDFKAAHSGKNVSYAVRLEEQKMAAQWLGGPEVLMLELAPAARFDTVPQMTFVSAFDELFARFDEVYVPFPSYNFDHERVWKATMAAFRPGKLDQTSLYAYEQPGQGAADRQPWGLIQGKRYSALSEEDVDMKCRAIREHHSQFDGRYKTLAGTCGVVSWAQWRGLEIGVPYAEVVFPIKEVVL